MSILWRQLELNCTVTPSADIHIDEPYRLSNLCMHRTSRSKIVHFSGIETYRA